MINMKVPDRLLDMYSSKIECMSNNQFNEFINSISKTDNIKSGSFSNVYFEDANAIKIYKEEPKLYSREDELILGGKHVVLNLFSILDISHNDIIVPDKLYVVNNLLKGYKARYVDMPTLYEINTNELLVSDIINAWIKAYDISEVFSRKNILMYDLNETNCFLQNSDFKICDLDFYAEEKYNQFVYENNYSLINNIFVNFIERLIFDYCVTIRDDEYLLETRDYVDYAFDELECMSGVHNPKTLSDIGLNL